MAKKEEDLAIDFSGIGRKIGSFFRKDGSGHDKYKAHAAHQEHAPKDAEHHEAKSHERKSGEDEEISIDLRKAGSFIVKNKTLFLLLIPIILAIFLRVYPIYLPVTDDWAKSSVDRYYTAQIMDQVSKQYPNLPAENKEAIANENLQKYISENKEAYEQQIQQVSGNFKSQFQDETGHTYILDIDPWHWFRYVRNIVDHGYPGDYIDDKGIMIDNHMLAPLGYRMSNVGLHPYFGAYLHNLLSIFNSDISVMTSLFMLPLILSVLIVIPAFFVGRKIGGDLGGIFASILLISHPSLLARTTAGVPDTDAYTILFPLAIVWLFFEAINSKDAKKSMMYSCAAGLLVAIFSATWYGWWFIFDFLLAVSAIYMVYLAATRAEKGNLLSMGSKTGIMCVSLLCFVVFSALFVVIFTNYANFSNVYTQPISFINIKQSANPSLWPNVFTTVAELNEASFSQIIQSIGGKLLFAISIIGIILAFAVKKEGKANVEYGILLVVWFLATIYASTKGIRFVNLLVPAFALGVGAAVGISFEYLSRWIVKELNINKMICYVLLGLLMMMILIAPIKSAQVTSRQQVPLINDAWYNALTNVKTNSTKDAIVNSWWDFGHWFKAVTDRAVTFDGASQNRPQAHWIGHVLLTEKEDEAIGILRMLDCGANTAFEVVNNQTNNMHKSIDIIYDVIVLDRQKAKELLEKNMPAEAAENVLRYTHCSPPEDYFITSEDMVGKAGVWAHFGSWDFERAKIWSEFRKLSMDDAVAAMVREFNYSEEKAQNIYYEMQSITDERQANDWISPWPGYAGAVGCQKIDNSTLQCVFGLNNQMIPVKADLKKMEFWLDAKDSKMYPASAVYLSGEDTFTEKKYSNNTIPYSVALLKRGEDYQAILMMPQLAPSIFTRLFYFGGVGLKHFDKFDHQIDISGQNIIVWKVDWEGKK